MNPRKQLEKIVTVTTAWTNLRPAKSFSGRGLEQFTAKVQASHDVRVVIANLESQLEAAYTRLTTVDKASLEEIRIVVHGVKVRLLHQAIVPRTLAVQLHCGLAQRNQRT